jgi:myosin heavy subunit
MRNALVCARTNKVQIPHVFSIAASALNNLVVDNTDQSILISGESGAGKTEATKKVLQFLSTMAASTASRAGASVDTQILDSNPLLESFGNAKTVRNNNSSRFGKYMEINFNNRNEIKGCQIISYLLEKSRVIGQAQTERNYHSFYMLLGQFSII